jgi:hypothetical protein
MRWLLCTQTLQLIARSGYWDNVIQQALTQETSRIEGPAAVAIPMFL